MDHDVAFINGQFVPASAARVSVQDAGFMLGITVAEQLRTFRGRLFRLDQHVQRLANSLEIVGLALALDFDQLKTAAQELASRNHALLAKGDDLGLSMFVTPGTYATFTAGAPSEPFVCMHTYPVPFRLFANSYHGGESLVIPAVRQVPAACWPVNLKCRSRMHYYLADKQARETEKGSRALLLDTDGNVSEASTASVFIYREGHGLTAPPEEKILPGISLSVVKELASSLGHACEHRELSPSDVASADEVMLCSTSPCLLPVVRVEQRPIADGQPGPVFRRLLEAWTSLVGLDIEAQARQFASR